MRETARKWGKRLLWVLPALLVVYLLVHLADYVWFRVRTPTRFQTANWSGSWRTEQYGGLSGRLLVRPPHPLPADEDFDAEAVVYYPIYSGWRTGQFVRMDFKGHFSPDDSASSGKTTRMPPGGSGKLTNWIPNKSGKLKFKGTAGNQTVEYVTQIDPSHTRMVGRYLSQGPYDHGTFVINAD